MVVNCGPGGVFELCCWGVGQRRMGGREGTLDVCGGHVWKEERELGWMRKRATTEADVLSLQAGRNSWSGSIRSKSSLRAPARSRGQARWKLRHRCEDLWDYKGRILGRV